MFTGVLIVSNSSCQHSLGFEPLWESDEFPSCLPACLPQMFFDCLLCARHCSMSLCFVLSDLQKHLFAYIHTILHTILGILLNSWSPPEPRDVFKVIIWLKTLDIFTRQNLSICRNNNRISLYSRCKILKVNAFKSCAVWNGRQGIWHFMFHWNR